VCQVTHVVTNSLPTLTTHSLGNSNYTQLVWAG